MAGTRGWAMERSVTRADNNEEGRTAAVCASRRGRRSSSLRSVCPTLASAVWRWLVAASVRSAGQRRFAGHYVKPALEQTRC
jgi:hypothetical protein